MPSMPRGGERERGGALAAESGQASGEVAAAAHDREIGEQRDRGPHATLRWWPTSPTLNPIVVSDLFGIHRTTAHTWARFAQTSWAAYLAASDPTDPGESARIE
jgi:hypothetical protein